ncbi:MAG: ribonuclease P protein component [Rhizomicrobium sp.]|nr:ribonuclease P protein component [Rhizomicrobium sp.]
MADHLRKRADFLRAQKGVRRSSAGLTLEVCTTPEPVAKAGRIRVGFTASRKVGNAVARNRAKRRLRAVAQAILSEQGIECTDYVLVARTVTLTRPYDALLKDLAQILTAAHVKLAAQAEAAKLAGDGDDAKRSDVRG